MSGWIKLERGWLKSNDFAKEPFTEREAWLWLIESAAWERHTRFVNGHAINLERGDVLVSQRTLADELGWGRQRVRGFIAKLELLKSISQNSTHGLTLISLTNYAKYQDQKPDDQPSSNPAATQQQPIKEEGKEDKEDKEDTTAAQFAFSGKVIRLTAEAFSNWERAFPDIDLTATLQSRDDWLAHEADTQTRRRWFISTSNYLSGKQNAAKLERDPLPSSAPMRTSAPC